MRRTFRADALMTMFPSVTCPSPPMATRSPRRTERMVVPWNSWGSGGMSGLYHPPGAGAGKITIDANAISGGPALHQDGIAVDPEGLEERGVVLVQVREAHALARVLHA